MVDRWGRESGKNQHLSAIRDLLRLLATELYSQYQPFPDALPFWERLRKWLSNVPDGDVRKHLFEFVPWLLFVGRQEMEVMYRAAFTGPISRWIIDEAKLDIAAADFTSRYKKAVDETFFGSIAGMDIGSFIRVNEVRGQSLRPDFRVLSRLGDPRKASKYLTSIGKLRVVAVEDYVGTGSQMEEAAQFLSCLKKFQVLLCPLIVAPSGVAMGEELAKRIRHLRFAPTFVVPPSATLPADFPGIHEPEEISNIRAVAIRFWTQVQGASPDLQLYEPFGFQNTGSLVMTYFNCPDNVPPLIHHLSSTWEPLFRRLYREA